MLKSNGASELVGLRQFIQIHNVVRSFMAVETIGPVMDITTRGQAINPNAIQHLM